MTQLKIIASSGLVVFILVFGLATSPAFSMHVMCGSTIFVDTDLDSNLIDCTGDGIIIGADNIKLRLKGFIIDGDPTGSGNGISLSNRVKVTVENAVVREFTRSPGLGISIQGGGGNRIKGVVVADNLAGIEVINSNNNEIKNNTVSNNGNQGVILSGPLSTRNKVKENEVYGHATIGIRIVASASDNKISKNNVHNNQDGVRALDADNNMIKGNQISQNSLGIRLNFDADGNIVKGNDITNNGTGLQVGLGAPINSNDNNVIEENIFANNIVGVNIFAGNNNNRIEENTFSANIAEPFFDQITDNGSGTVVVDNICDPPDGAPICN